jgi:hypothetical protein
MHDQQDGKFVEQIEYVHQTRTQTYLHQHQEQTKKLELQHIFNCFFHSLQHLVMMVELRNR